MTQLPHLLSIKQFDTSSISTLFATARAIENGLSQPVAQGRITTNLFYEPSTRTSSSFYSAMVRLGGSVIPINDVSFSSVSKGENLEDTIRTLASYSDCIVLRHPEKGAAQWAAAVSPVPIINAGDGVGEHPTQALLDLYTIQRHLGLNRRVDVCLMGDLRHGRTVHSLVRLLRLYDVRLHLVSPPGLEMPSELCEPEDKVYTSLDQCVAQADVIYVTRVQKERIAPHLQTTLSTYQLSPDHMSRAKGSTIIMHPLPRVDELPSSLDSDPRAVYFRQMRYGLYIRQAIFLHLFSGSVPWKF
jgi:aspartate carbamoyltransferase